MKNVYSLFLLMILGLMLIGCNSGEQKAETKNDAIKSASSPAADLENFEQFDLRPYEINASIMLPKEGDISVKHQLDDFTWQILIDKQVYVTIQDWGTENGLERYLQQVKKENKSIDFIEQEKDFVIYKSTVGTKEITYHTAAQHSIEGINYVFKSSQPGISKEKIEQVVKSVE